MADFRKAIHRLREDLDRLKQMIQDIINKSNLSEQDIEVRSKNSHEFPNQIIPHSFFQALRKSLLQLEQNKADKTTVANELDKVFIRNKDALLFLFHFSIFTIFLFSF